MATIPTNNSVPSEAAVDIRFNAAKIDEFVSSSETAYIDRMGVKRLTAAGIRRLSSALGPVYENIERAQNDIDQGIIPNNGIFFVSSENNEIIADEYQNLSGIAVTTGKNLPSTDALSVFGDKFNGVNNLFTHQNRWLDDTLNLFVNGNPVGAVTDTNGGRYFKTANAMAFVIPYISGDAAHLVSTNSNSAYLQYENTLENIGGVAGEAFTFMYRVVSKSGSTTNNDRILFQQFNGDTEITAARVTHSHPASPLFRPVERSVTVTLDATCTKIRFYVAVSSQSSTIDIDNILLAPGIVNTYRPPLAQFVSGIANTLKGEIVRPITEALGLTQTQPNIFDADAINILTIKSVVSGAGTLSPAAHNHTPAWAAVAPAMPSGSSEAGFRLGTFSRSSFGDVMSASLNLLHLDSNRDETATVRILLRQMTAGGAELTAARRTIASFGGNGFTSPRLIEVSGVAIESDCDSIDIFIGINNKLSSATRTLYFRDPLLCTGVNAQFRQPARADVRKFQLLASSPNIVPHSDFRDIGDYIPNSLWSKSVAIVDRNGERCVMIPGTVSGDLITTDKYDVSGYTTRTFSASVLIMEKIGDQGTTPGGLGNLRIRLQAYNAAGARLDVWQNVPGNEGGGAAYYDRSVPRSDIIGRHTFVVAEGLTLPDGVKYLAYGFRSESFTATPSPVMYLTKLNIREGIDFAWVPSTHSSTTSVVSALSEAWISQTGSDTAGNGSRALPFATTDRALDAIGGVGSIHLTEGVFHGLQFNVSKIKDVDIFGADTLTHNKTTIIYGVPVTGITKTEGYSKIYQATVNVAGQPCFIWLDGVTDINTPIIPAERHPLDRGQDYRLPSTKIYRTYQRTNRVAALAEIEAGAVPLCFKYTEPDDNTQILYFSVPDGVDATTAPIYVADNTGFGFFKGLPPLWAASGKCRVHGIDIKYAAFNVRGFRSSALYNCMSLGAPLNAFDIAWDCTLRLCIAAAAGSNESVNGDGFNAHNKADWTHYDCYAHDCNDDGWSSHENCVETGYGPLCVFNGGGGLTPSYGAHAIYYNPTTIRNSINPRAPIVKQGGITCVGGPAAGDDGSYTNCVVFNGVSIGDKNGYHDNSIDGSASAYLTAINCISIDPVDTGYKCFKTINCEHAGSGNAKHSAVIVQNTSRLVG